MNTSISNSSISIRPLRADAVGRAAIAVLAALLALLTLGAMRPPVAAAASAPGTSTPDLAAIDRYVEAERRATRLPGLALGIVHGDQVVHLQGFGDADRSGRPVAPQTPFILASTTKSFTALAVMQLVEQDRIALDDAVGPLVPELASVRVLQGFDAAGVPRLRALPLLQGKGLDRAPRRKRGARAARS